MTFAQLIATVRDWQSRMPPEQARKATESMLGYGIVVERPIGAPIDVDAVLAFAAGGKPLAEQDVVAFLRGLAPSPSWSAVIPLRASSWALALSSLPRM